MLQIYDKETNKFLGISYNEDKQEYRDFHTIKNQGAMLISDDSITTDNRELTSDELLENAKADKIKAIDAQTGLEIEAIVGDNNKQKDLLAERSYLLELKFDGIIKADEQTRLDELKDFWFQVSNLKYNGKNREATVELVEITTTLAEAIADIEAI